MNYLACRILYVNCIVLKVFMCDLSSLKDCICEMSSFEGLYV